MAGRPITPPSLVQDATGVWQIKHNDGTRQRFKSTGTKVYVDALKLFGRWLAGDHVSQGPPTITVAQVVDYWVEHRLPHTIAKLSNAGTMQRLKAGLGDETIETIGRESVGREYRRKRFAGELTKKMHNSDHKLSCASPNTIRHELMMLTTAFRFYLAEHNDTRRVPTIWLPGEVEAETRTLTPDEQRKLLDATAKPKRGRVDRLHRFLELALAGAQRRGCIESLRWDFNVDLKRGKIDFRTAEYRARQANGDKPKKRQLADFTIPADLLSKMRDWHEERISNFVLDHPGKLYARFKRLCNKLGIENAHPHLTRHTRLTEVLDAGVSTAHAANAFDVTGKTLELKYFRPDQEGKARIQATRRRA